MVATRAVIPKCFKMLLCAISLVFGKAVLWEFRIQSAQQAVAGDLGDDAGGGNREGAAITLHNGKRGAWQAGHGQSVHDGEVGGRRRQCGERAGHGLMCGAENIKLIDFQHVGLPDGPGHVWRCRQQNKKTLALECGKRFRIVDSAQDARLFCDEKFPVEDQSCGDHRAGQRAAACFINARQSEDATFPRVLFEREQLSPCRRARLLPA